MAVFRPALQRGPLPSQRRGRLRLQRLGLAFGGARGFGQRRFHFAHARLQALLARGSLVQPGAQFPRRFALGVQRGQPAAADAPRAGIQRLLR
ncbi:hypothetical protein AD428_23195, partial [Achromobacter sp. DMS1]|uniref:hypothetical protein n=1 Tax=Achromobacter sp. DMS1 TaxID=1688405 RepID=UPI0006C66839